MTEGTTTFESLLVGQRFRFFAGGALLMKTGRRSYDNPAWDQRGLTVPDITQAVIVDNSIPSGNSDTTHA